MQDFYGTKRVQAEPEERDGKPGFAVVYEDGYRSWSPADVFEAAYQPITAMSFGHALVALKAGHRVSRAGWNGKGMWLAYMPKLELPPFSTQDTNRKVNDRTARWIGEDTPLYCLPYIAMWTADQKWQPGWLASQTDMLADDWGIVP